MNTIVNAIQSLPAERVRRELSDRLGFDLTARAMNIHNLLNLIAVLTYDAQLFPDVDLAENANGTVTARELRNRTHYEMTSVVEGDFAERAADALARLALLMTWVHDD